jgi:hypothetical protein
MKPILIALVYAVFWITVAVFLDMTSGADERARQCKDPTIVTECHPKRWD